MSRMAGLSREETRRYARHLVMPEVGPAGQEKLKAARVLLVGAGGLGSPAALYLAAAGVGTLGVIDMDVVDESNLQRQILHNMDRVGERKVDSAKKTLTALNPDVNVVTYDVRLGADNVLDIIDGYDAILDGTDNFPTRYLVNDACVLTGKPNVYASIFRFEGQASVFWARKGPCYRCLYPEPPPPGLVPSCAEGGVLGILPGLLGVLQATETVKLILGSGEPLIGRLLLVDALAMRFRELALKKNPDCVVCGRNPTVTTLVDYEAFCGGPVVSSPAMFGARVPEMTVEELKQARDRGEAVVLVDVREPREFAISDLPGSVKIPLGTLPQSLDKVPKDADVIVYCRTGGRSAQAVQFLMANGYTRAKNLAGGINRWADAIDPSMAKY